MPDIKFPRYIFAIGGAGKNLLYTILEREWILKEIIRPKFSPTMIDVTIIDTAIDEENDDLERIEKIEGHIKKIEEEHRSNMVSTSSEGRILGRINISYMLLTKDMVLQSPYDLIGITKEVKNATGASVWWINDPDQLGEDWHKKIINKENFKELNFTKGVYRKRAIGKAIYYKAISEGKFDIDLLSSAQVDILVGLGGGTGSGMAFDLAKKLKSIQPTADIVLFGILSTLDESADEKANNFAMISETEYGYLNRDTPFKNIVLVPMEVTGYPGRERASDEHERLLKEFDETFPYILMAYHNNPAQLFFSNLPDYAPFMISTSQLVRYNVASIKRLKDRLIEAFNDKEMSLKEEEEVYGNIKKFITEFYKEDELKGGGLPDDDKTFIKEDRFAKFNIVLGHQFFKELDYNSVKYLKRAVDAGISGSGSDEIEKQISSIKAEVETIVIGEEGYKEDADMRLHKILRKDIENIDTIKDLLGVVNKIPNNMVRDTLKIIIKVDEYSLGRKLNQIREETERINGRRKQLEGNIKSLEEDIANYENKIKTDIDKKNQEWKQNEIKNIQLLETIDDRSPIIINNFSNLKNELDEYATRINSINNIKNIETESTKNIENAAEKLSQEMEKLGIFYEDKSSITKNLIIIKDLKKAQIDSKRKIPIVDKALGVLFKTDRIRRQKEAKNRLQLKITELNSDKIFDIRDGIISCSYNYDIQYKINYRKDEIIEEIIKRIRDMLSRADESLLSGLKSILLDPSKRKNANIEEIARSDLGYEIDIQNRYNGLKEKREELNKVSGDANILRSLENLLKTMTVTIKNHSRNLKNYYTNIANVEKDVVAMHSASKESIRYIMEMQPTNIYKATLTGANINNILVDQDELSTLKQNLQGGLERTIDSRYNILAKRIIETNDNRNRWKNTKIMTTFITPANIEPEDIDSRRTVSSSFGVERDNYSQWKLSSGDIWEIGLVLFIAAVPFDNIRNIIDSRAGYYRYYKNINDNGIAFFHHSYMLDQGKYVQRKKVFNLEYEEDKNVLLQNDKDARNTFLQNYETKDIKNCMSNEDNIQ